jgi:hypothetical protein
MGAVIRVAGVDVPLAAITNLALELHSKRQFRSLTATIDRAVDGGSRKLNLNQKERAELRAALTMFPDERLEPLREVLSGKP